MTFDTIFKAVAGQQGMDTGELHRRAGAEAERAAIVRHLSLIAGQLRDTGVKGDFIDVVIATTEDIAGMIKAGKHLEATDDEG